MQLRKLKLNLMTDFNKNNPFKIPKKYFQELEYLLTENTNVKNNLSTPKDYFNTLEEEILKEFFLLKSVIKFSFNFLNCMVI